MRGAPGKLRKQYKKHIPDSPDKQHLADRLKILASVYGRYPILEQELLACALALETEYRELVQEA